MNAYTVPEILEFIRTINCMSFDRFKEMYKNLFSYATDGYIEEKFNISSRDIAHWMCELDYKTLDKMMT